MRRLFVRCDLNDPATFGAALDGVSAVFLYAESSQIGEFVQAATDAKVEHVVLLSSSSVLEPGAADDLLARHHLEVDLARCALAVLIKPELSGRSYWLAGPESLTFGRQVEHIADVLARSISVRPVSREKWKTEMADHVPARTPMPSSTSGSARTAGRYRSTGSSKN
jgi:uncharacterized protein YbjT (DUF2867 family)